MVLALSLVVSIGCLWIQQLQAILGNITGIEQWIVKKAENRHRKIPFVYPYDLGWYRNWKMVMGPSLLAWISPVRITSKNEYADGIDYPIKEGCGKYDLTIEQLIQKQLKRHRSYTANVQKTFNTGCTNSSLNFVSLCVRYGFCSIYNYPGCDEACLSVKPGDQLLVTRKRKYWIYARKLASNGRTKTLRSNKKSNEAESLAQREAGTKEWSKRGWVPVACVRELPQTAEDFQRSMAPPKTMIDGGLEHKETTLRKRNTVDSHDETSSGKTYSKATRSNSSSDEMLKSKDKFQ
eukprot:CAMPEP_0167744878 /NCGR_PEP_ID=MMETSP0110_2-20121227/2837_1 /TAXON_ID=629695 /ORGANISM="Gymnochlora sp., Strain CCMP2014" /LENGTH=292 /DNA_ID=CAMNT_0007629451 /DNA_START=576 /DNA_END=1454 /DNA_ORIENTATION=+